MGAAVAIGGPRPGRGSSSRCDALNEGACRTSNFRLIISKLLSQRDLDLVRPDQTPTLVQLQAQSVGV